ncbi:MAG: YciI family protein [Saprospiraceae bacterium]
MYIINITYKVPLETVDHYLESHVAYLNEQYKQGYFLASGRKVPRTGGIIISNVSDKLELTAIIEKDPFKMNDLADYELIEFIPSKTNEVLSFLLDQ